jgi:hypothetical protein
VPGLRLRKVLPPEDKSANVLVRTALGVPGEELDVWVVQGDITSAQNVPGQEE